MRFFKRLTTSSWRALHRRQVLKTRRSPSLLTYVWCRTVAAVICEPHSLHEGRGSSGEAAALSASGEAAPLRGIRNFDSTAPALPDSSERKKTQLG